MSFVLTAIAAAGASAVELLEALAIVLAVGVTRGFRNALSGALLAVAAVIGVCVVLGPTIRAIVFALGASPGHLAPALFGAALALAAVTASGVLLRRPLQRLPETQVKLAMGVALTAFGAYFAAQGLGVHWPLTEVSPLYLTALFAAVAWLAIRRLARSAAVAGPA